MPFSIQHCSMEATKDRLILFPLFPHTSMTSERAVARKTSTITTGRKRNQLTSILNCSSSHIKDHFILIYDEIRTQIVQNYIIYKYTNNLPTCVSKVTLQMRYKGIVSSPVMRSEKARLTRKLLVFVRR